MDDLSTQFKAQTDLYLESIQTRIAELFKESIQESIYDYYSPTEYNRTNMFLESTKTHIDLETGIMYVYSDLNSGYPSAVDRSPQYSNLSNFIEGGHSDSTGYGGGISLLWKTRLFRESKRANKSRIFRIRHTNFERIII